MNYLITLILCLCLAGCAERIEPTPQAGDVHQLPAIEWRIVDRAELERVYRDAGMPLTDKQSLRGFVAKRDDQVVVFTLPPRSVDDDVTTTLGHEVMHVALGDYHR
ncbi:MAG: hypothetical protein NVV60_01405 [Luteimonas sp.]|nr:hypothetical protein [Luteimonas sp.]